jgi:hypothetical protein
LNQEVAFVPNTRRTAQQYMSVGKTKSTIFVFGEYYILCGSACKPLQEWLIGTWANGEWRHKKVARLSFSQVEVPYTAKIEKAVTIDGLLYKDHLLDWNPSMSKLSTIQIWYKDALIRRIRIKQTKRYQDKDDQQPNVLHPPIRHGEDGSAEANASKTILIVSQLAECNTIRDGCDAIRTEGHND